MSTDLKTGVPDVGFVVEDCLGPFVPKPADMLHLNAETVSRVRRARTGLPLLSSVGPMYLRSMLEGA